MRDCCAASLSEPGPSSNPDVASRDLRCDEWRNFGKGEDEEGEIACVSLP